MIYAIDFGTSNSLLAAADTSHIYPPVSLDPSAPDPSVMRSVLYFPNMSRCYFGTEAIQQFAENTGRGRLIRSIKKYLPIRSFVGTYIEDRPVNLENLIGFFLRELRTRANAHFKKDVDAVVLGRPARFADDDADDQYAQVRLEQAAKLAGFREIHFCPEPIAAAFDFKSQLTEPKVVLVADFGGGTSDFTVIRIGPDAYQPSDVFSIGGVSLAGDALDGGVMRHKLATHFGADVAYSVPFSSNVLKMPAHLASRLCSAPDIALLVHRDTQEFFRNVRKWAIGDEDREKLDRLTCLVDEQLGFPVFEAIEAAKRELSAAAKAKLVYDHPAVGFDKDLSRSDFESYVKDPIERILQSLDATVKDAGLDYSQIDLVCCTGGTARVPLLHQALVERFGEAKIQERNRFHSIVHGLARRGQQILAES